MSFKYFASSLLTQSIRDGTCSNNSISRKLCNAGRRIYGAVPTDRSGSIFMWFYFFLVSDELNCLHNTYHINGCLRLASLFLLARNCFRCSSLKARGETTNAIEHDYGKDDSFIAHADGLQCMIVAQYM